MNSVDWDCENDEDQDDVDHPLYHTMLRYTHFPPYAFFLRLALPLLVYQLASLPS